MKKLSQENKVTPPKIEYGDIFNTPPLKILVFLKKMKNFIDLIKNLNNKDFLYNFFVEARLIDVNSVLVCNACSIGFVKLVKDCHKKLGKTLKCNNSECNKRMDILKGTYFHQKNIQLHMYVIGCFIEKKKIATIRQESGHDEKSIIKIYNELREICVNTQARLPKTGLGGFRRVVEIDETHLFTRKYNIGNVLASEHVWVLGAIERETKNIYLEVLENRDAETLSNIVDNTISEGTVIMADGWKRYSKIEDNYNVFKVFHKYNFVNPFNSEIHINNIDDCVDPSKMK